jgi:hypothetical protein
MAPVSATSVSKITDRLKFGSIINGSDINNRPAAAAIEFNINLFLGYNELTS